MGRMPHRSVPAAPSTSIAASCPSAMAGTLAAGSVLEFAMSKRGRKKKSRKKNSANHGNRPNS